MSGQASRGRCAYQNRETPSVSLNILMPNLQSSFPSWKLPIFFKNLPVSEFAERSAHFLAELNAIHAFREGNGRTQLTFFALLADRARQLLDLEKMDPDAMLSAMVSSFGGNESELARVIGELIK
jgi:cell filamentation protein